MAQGDTRALEVLADRHGPPLMRLAYRMLDDAAEAEDVTQEAFVRLWDRAAGWVSHGGGVAGWLRRTATNACIDRMRRRSRLADAPDVDRPDESPGAERMIDAARLGTLVQRALATLPERQRAAVVLTYYEEITNAAAAEILDMHLKAFESLLFRARARLRDGLAAAGVTAEDLEGWS